MKQPPINFHVIWRNNDNTFKVNEAVKGTVHVECEEDTPFSKFDIKHVLTLRGQAKPVIMPGENISLEARGVWKAGKKYSYDFSLPGATLPSFVGRNLQVVWTLKLTYELEKTAHSKQEKGFFGRVKKFRGSKFYEKIFEVSNANKLTIKKETKSADSTSWLVLLALIFPAIAFFAYDDLPIIMVILFTGIGGGIALYGTIMNLIETYYFRGAKVSFSAIENNYIEGCIQFASPHKGQDVVQFGYLIKESVLDNRGTSLSTLNAVLINTISPEEFPLQGNYLPFKVPINDKFPPSFEFKSHSINWYLQINMPPVLGINYVKKIPIEVCI